MLDKELISKAAELIGSADAIAVAAGAGIGVDSGLPDFRGNEGFWKAYPALARARLNFTEVASPRTFDKDPVLAWGFYGHRLNMYRQTVPHEGFNILKKWGDNALLGARIFTSNVDGQFQKAGFAADQIHECHGSIHHLQCTDECETGIWSADDFKPEVDQDQCRLLNTPPVCPHCKKLARPNILMFSDWSWHSGRSDIQHRTESTWLAQLAGAKCNLVVVEIGAGTAIPSVRNFSHNMSLNYGARIIRINPRESQVPSPEDVGLASGSLEALRQIDFALVKK